MMGGCWQHLLLLWLIAVGAMNILGNGAEAVKDAELQVMNCTNKSLQVIPKACNNSNVTKLMIEGNQITLNQADRVALTSYPKLVELHLDGNLVTNISAMYFSVVPQLKVLSLSRNHINSLDLESFAGLDDLTELDLSHNLLTSLCSQLFKGLNCLKVLNLQGNPWNCSSPLLSTIKEIKAAGVTIAGPRTTCASPAEMIGKDLLKATAECYPSPPPSSTTNPTKESAKTTIKVLQYGFTTTTTPAKPALTSTPKSIITSSHNSIITDDKVVFGNSWKFAAGVAAMALCVCMLIVGAIKGPSWYKLLHNYRHQRLNGEDDGGENFASTIFSETGAHLSHQTFTFGQNNRQRVEGEEDEDGYYEDPYIRKQD